MHDRRTIETISTGKIMMLLLVSLTVSTLQAAPSPDTAHVRQWHTKTISFEGPKTSEFADPNPFTDFRLQVTFTHTDARYVVRGFYAADGNAAETGAKAGRVWQVRFAPDRVGTWNYSATLRTREGIAVDDRPDAGSEVPIQSATGSFEAIAAGASTDERDFRRRGRLIPVDGYLRFGAHGPYLLKGGANSPENLLAFADFDDTYRQQADARDGEAAPPSELHAYAAHVADWRPGDPTWRNGKGKGLVGAINYLSSTGMNAVYFLTLNIGGDGKDVWPYADPRDFTRFDCSKLDQWEIVFQHMQRRGVMMHVVTQETENERMLDDGDTGFLRKLYYRELIARFSHHPALVWNLGEENGPASFSPNGQTLQQQKTMASYIHDHDPYGHAVQIHTHSTRASKDELLPPLLGHPTLDGLSFQVNRHEDVHTEIVKWRREADSAERPWLISMDEIGPWHTGALPDAEDPTHDSLRRHVLWGALMAGGAGVEWYFGAKHPHNDLNSEDWRQRANLWKQTRCAIDFFEDYLPYWEMQPADELTDSASDFCFAKPGSAYAIYVPKPTGPFKSVRLDLQGYETQFHVRWFDPIHGGPLQSGSIKRITGTGKRDLGLPPTKDNRDWVILVVDSVDAGR